MGEQKAVAKKAEANKESSRKPKTEVSQSISPQVDQILQLQQTIGNEAVGRLIKSGALRTKLKVGLPNDIYEREAEKISKNIVSSSPSPDIQQKLIGNGAIQRKAGHASNSIPESTIRNPGSGQPLKSSTKSTLESGIGADLGKVRVHSDRTANEAADALNARAFTHGSDIWLGKGESQDDLGLMAHEAAHVMQQGKGVNRIQRAGKSGEKDQPLEKTFSSPKGTIDTESKIISIPVLKLPKIRGKVKGAEGVPPIAAGKPLTIPKKKERNTKQRENWDKKIKESTELDTALTKKLEKAPDMVSDGKKIYYLMFGDGDLFFIGSIPTIKPKLLRPFWDEKGKFHRYDVDHKTEIQLGGEDILDNYELLDSVANQSSGRNIHNEIITKIDALLTAGENQVFRKKPEIDKIREKYDITFNKVDATLGIDGLPKFFWSLEDIEKGEHIKPLKVLTEAQIKKFGLKGGPEFLMIYTSSAGIGRRRIPWGEKTKTKSCKNYKFYPNFSVNRIDYNGDKKKGKLFGVAFRDNKYLEEAPMDFDIQEKEGVEWGGYVEGGSIKQQANSKLKAKGWSPVRIDETEILEDKGIAMKGQILPDIPLFENLGLDLEIEGKDIMISKTFSSADFKFPGPVLVTNTSLKVAAGTRGIEAKGNVQFEIQRVGEGELVAFAGTNGTFGLKGSFDFDSTLFEPANISMTYENNKFSGSGILGIKEGKVRGIKSANITASYKEGKLEATGTADLTIPGIKQGAMSLSYSEAEGLAIGGSFQLADNIPGIKSGSVEAMVRKKPGGEGYEVTAKGKATPKIPGVDATVSVIYENGAFTIEGTAAYKKGMLKGSILVGATNLPVDAAGKPGGEPTKKLTAYGGGTVTIQIAPWLQGTIGVKLLPNGEVEVSGTIGLPSTLNITPEEKKLNKNLFTSPSIDIPIVGVSVLGKRVGIFASISGGLDLNAGFGPVQLQELSLSVTYNPAHEEQTTVVGKGKLHIPAHAGIRLFIRGSIGASLLIVTAEGGLEVGGELGLAGALDAGVQIDWSPAKGLVLDAFGEIYVEPKFRFDITGFVLVEADLLLKTVELYSKRWELYAFEYGSGLRLGMKFPIHYEEGKPFDVSLKDIQFQIPEIKPKEVLSDLVKKIA